MRPNTAGGVWLVGALCFGAAVSACSSSSSEAPAQAPVVIKQSSADWNMLGYDLASTYWNQGETKLTKKTAPTLDKAWDFDGGGSVTSTPVVSAGKVYVVSQGVIAIDLVSGTEIWRSQAVPDAGYVTASSSLALSDGVLYLNDSSGVVHALNAKDGKEVWQYTTPDAPGAAGFSSPIITKDYVIYSLSTNEELSAKTSPPVSRGFIGALHKDGTPAWQKFMVSGDEHGATLWSTPSVDEALGAVYGATGNNHGPPAGTTSDGFVAVPLANGGDFLWTQQIFVGDIWTSANTDSPDNDFGANPIVFDTAGKKLIAGGNKGGDFWVLDRDKGTVLKKVNLGPGSAFKGGVFVSGAWDGKRLLVVCNGATSTEPGGEAADGASPVAVLYALDPLTLSTEWARQIIGPVYSPITVANGVGFFGKNTTLQAFDTETGAVLKEFTTEATIATAPVISNGYVVFGSGMSWLQATAGSKYYALKVQ